MDFNDIDTTYDGILNVQTSSVTMAGIWPGRYGATAILMLTHSHSKNFMAVTLKLAEHLRKMHARGGRETTRKMLTCLHRHDVRSKGGDPIPQRSIDRQEVMDGRQYYDMLEDQALAALMTFNGRVSVGPFVLSTDFLPPQLRRESDRRFYAPDPFTE